MLRVGFKSLSARQLCNGLDGMDEGLVSHLLAEDVHLVFSEILKLIDIFLEPGSVSSRALDLLQNGRPSLTIVASLSRVSNRRALIALLVTLTFLARHGNIQLRILLDVGMSR